jgi:hypothetical protein
MSDGLGGRPRRLTVGQVRWVHGGLGRGWWWVGRGVWGWLSGWRGSPGGTIGRLPVPRTRAQPWWVLRSWWWSQKRSRLPVAVSCTAVHGSRWSCSMPQRRVQPATVHSGEDHNRAIFCAALGPRPRLVTLTTSTPDVMTSLSTDSPSSARAAVTDTGPTPATSHTSPLWTRPRTSASTSTLSNARWVGSACRPGAGLRAGSEWVGDAARGSSPGTGSG